MAFLASGTIDDGGPNGRKSGGFGEVRLLRHEADLVQGGIFPAGGPFLRDDLFQEGVSTSLEGGITFGGFEFALRAREGAEKNEKRVAADHGSSEFFEGVFNEVLGSEAPGDRIVFFFKLDPDGAPSFVFEETVVVFESLDAGFCHREFGVIQGVEFFGVEHSIEGILLERDLEPGSLFLFGMKKWEGEGGGETGSQKGSASEVEMEVHFEWSHPYRFWAGSARGNWSSLAGSAVPR